MIYSEIMKRLKYVYWQDSEQWLGYFLDFPDYRTQGETLDDLKDHLKDLFSDLDDGESPR